MTQYAPELVERMVAHIRAVSARHPKRPNKDAIAQGDWDELQALAALTKPVDPDLIAARKIAIDAYPNYPASTRDAILRGERDSEPGWGVSFALAGIKFARSSSNIGEGR